MDKSILIVSDLHLGAGEKINGQRNPLEDFHFDERFADFLSFQTRQYPHHLELIILGDAFDFPQVLPEIGFTCSTPKLGTTQEESMRRLELIIQGHGVFFKALRNFLLSGKNTARFIRGNHDIDLLWPNVQDRLRREIMVGDNLIFDDDYIYRYKGLYCEHGNQYSVENAFPNPHHPVKTDPQGKARIERCWGTYFVDVVYNGIETRFPIIDNVEDGQIIRGALMAIKSEKVHFTGRVVGQMLKIAFRAGLPIMGWIGSGTLGEDDIDAIPISELSSGHIVTAEDLLKNLRDQELSRGLLRKYKDDLDFRDQFDFEIAEVLQELAGTEVHLLPPKDINQTLGLVTGINAYQRAAESILQKEKGTKVVVFGHTHKPVDGTSIGTVNGSVIKYFNSGSWTICVDLDDVRNQGKNFDELCHSGIRKDSLDYVEVTVTSDKNVYAALGTA